MLTIVGLGQSSTILWTLLLFGIYKNLETSNGIDHTFFFSDHL